MFGILCCLVSDSVCGLRAIRKSPKSEVMSLMKSLQTWSTWSRQKAQTALKSCFWIPCNLFPTRFYLQYKNEKHFGPHHILVRSQDGGGNDSQEQADHVEHHWGPQETVQVDDVPAAADSGELIVLCVVLCAGGETLTSGEITCSHSTSLVSLPSIKLSAINCKGTLLKVRILETLLLFRAVMIWQKTPRLDITSCQ